MRCGCQGGARSVDSRQVPAAALCKAESCPWPDRQPGTRRPYPHPRSGRDGAYSERVERPRGEGEGVARGRRSTLPSSRASCPVLLKPSRQVQSLTSTTTAAVLVRRLVPRGGGEREGEASRTGWIGSSLRLASAACIASSRAGSHPCGRRRGQRRHAPVPVAQRGQSRHWRRQSPDGVAPRHRPGPPPVRDRPGVAVPASVPAHALGGLTPTASVVCLSGAGGVTGR